MTGHSAFSVEEETYGFLSFLGHPLPSERATTSRRSLHLAQRDSSKPGTRVLCICTFQSRLLAEATVSLDCAVETDEGLTPTEALARGRVLLEHSLVLLKATPMLTLSPHYKHFFSCLLS